MTRLTGEKEKLEEAVKELTKVNQARKEAFESLEKAAEDQKKEHTVDIDELKKAVVSLQAQLKNTGLALKGKIPSHFCSYFLAVLLLGRLEF